MYSVIEKFIRSYGTNIKGDKYPTHLIEIKINRYEMLQLLLYFDIAYKVMIIHFNF